MNIDTITLVEQEIIDNYLTDYDYDNIEQWATDSYYVLTTDGWLDLEGNPVNIEHCLLNAIIEEDTE